MKASGDSSVQLTKMNEDVMQKQRYATIVSTARPALMLHILSGSCTSLLVITRAFCRSSLRRLEELQGLLAEEKEAVARVSEQLQQEQAHREQELRETRDAHQAQINNLQEKVASLVGILRPVTKIITRSNEIYNLLSSLLVCVQEKTVKQSETSAQQLKASQEKSASEASELHGKELEALQKQVDALKQELSSSQSRSQELEKQVTELRPYKDQTQVKGETLTATDECYYITMIYNVWIDS